jgi:hypothetical protein
VLLEGSDVLHLPVFGYGEVAGLEVADGIMICVCNDNVFDDKICAAAKRIDGEGCWAVVWAWHDTATQRAMIDTELRGLKQI